jgi:hypothetical protein
VKNKIAHAKSYPFPSPDHSFLYANGRTEALTGSKFDRTGRTPVLAAGSNQSPEQIHRKYGDMTGEVVIPAQRGRLHDFDVVYAAHLTAYGSVPATFQLSPGTVVDVFVLWLTAPQLMRMHETERNYTYDRLSGLRLELDDAGKVADAGADEVMDEVMDEVFAYSSRFGCLNHAGDCVGIREISAQGRRFPALGQVAALEIVRDRFAPGTPVDDFVHQHLAERQVHRDRSTRLGEDALPLAYPRVTLESF